MHWPAHVADGEANLRRDAEEASRLTPEQRVEPFCSLMRRIQEIWSSLPPEEQWRRLQAGDQLEPGPRPWVTALPPWARP